MKCGLITNSGRRIGFWMDVMTEQILYPRFAKSGGSDQDKPVLQKGAALGLGVPGGRSWMRGDYWDRYVQDISHFRNVVDYIYRNPVEAGLCRTAAEGPWLSAELASEMGPGSKR